MTVIDTDRGAQYSLWQATYDPATDTYTSCGLTVYWNASNGLQKQVTGTDCTATYYAPDGCHGHRGFPPAIYNIRVDEIQDGVIPHALKLGVNDTCGFVWPAQDDEGCGVSQAPPEGTRLRLKASVDCSTLSTQAAQVVCATLQTYGLFVGDQTGGDAHIAVENTTLDGNAASDFWVGQLSSSSLQAFPFSTQYWDVVQMSYGGP